jgi:DNA-binding transcriptional MerR regulator
MSTPKIDPSALPVLTPDEFLDHVEAQSQRGAKAGRVLMKPEHIAQLLTSVGNFRLSARAVLGYARPRLGLVPPPLSRNGQTLFLYPDHFRRLNILLTLRQHYSLSLSKIRAFLRHFPAEREHLIVDRRLNREEVRELVERMPSGFTVGHIFMAKACDAMLEDVLPTGQAMREAIKPDQGMGLEERLILERLDELKAWISSGGRREFLREEAARDLENLTLSSRIFKRIWLPPKRTTR